MFEDHSIFQWVFRLVDSFRVHWQRWCAQNKDWSVGGADEDVQEDHHILWYLLRELLDLTDCIHYAGAGISTSAGIASAARSSGARNLLEHDLTTDAAPSFTHRALTCLHSAGLVTDWVQQNHDGLPQKAGYPQQHVIEVNDIVSILCRSLQLHSLCNCFQSDQF